MAFLSHRNHKVLAVQRESSLMVSLVPWQAEKPLTWDVTVVWPICMFAQQPMKQAQWLVQEED